MSSLQNLYAAVIREHAAAPNGFQPSFEPTHRHEALNPLCGDRVVILGRLERETIERLGFDGEGCAICMASASLLCQHLEGKQLAELDHYYKALTAALAGDDATDQLGSMNALLAVRDYPARVQCATLPWQAAIQAFPMADRPDTP